MIPVTVIRPQPGCDKTVADARAQGIDAHGFPLFEVSPLAWDPPDRETVDALLIGSANAVRHGGAALAAYRGKPAYAVGEASAEAARAAELDVVATGTGTLQELLAELDPGHSRLLRLAGEVHVPLDPPGGVNVVTRVLYTSRPQAMPHNLVELLRHPALVLLHSAEAARHFAAECDVNGLDRRQISLAALAPRVAEAAGTGWGRIETAAQPSDTALLALAAEMCQTPGGSRETSVGDTQSVLMQEENSPPPVPAATRTRSGRPLLLVAVLAFIAGAVLAGWLAMRGDLEKILPPAPQGTEAPAGQVLSGRAAPKAGQPDEPAAEIARMGPLESVETRLALLEDRLSRASSEATLASGNAARAEGLLIAFAARRLVDRGEKLGYVEDQLKLRFGDAQPLAVDTIITFSKQPVTVDELASRLTALEPVLTGKSREESAWSRITRGLSSLFVLHKSSSLPNKPADQVARARLLLTAGRIDQAIAQIENMARSEAAQDWIADAQRYAAVERALDQIETAAMLEPRRLKDGVGQSIEQPSPLTQPADAPPTP